jgi:diguanylate cyclase (GGDEF)-like protein/PAS domain S-box-containing protein
MAAKKLLSGIFVETLEQAMDSVVVIDLKNEIIFYNHAAEILWGYKKEDVIGKNVKILIPNHIKSNHDQYVNANRISGINKIVGTNRDVEIPCKDGSTKWGSMSISKVVIDGNNLYTAFIKDVTAIVIERKRIEMLSLVTDNTDNAILISDDSWNVIYKNKGFTNIFGYKSKEVLGRNPTSIVAPHYTNRQINKIRNTLRNGVAIKIDELLHTKNGQKLWCSVVINPVFNEKGSLTNIVSIFSDITKTKIHEVLQSKILGSIARDEPLEVIMESACHEVSQIIDNITLAVLQVDDNNCLQLLSSSKLTSKYKKLLNSIRIGKTVSSSPTAAYHRQYESVTDIKNDPLLNDFHKQILPFGYKGCWSFPIKGSHGELIGVIAFYKKDDQPPSLLNHQLISALAPLCSLAIERDRQQKNIRHLAYYDSLTQLPNRSMLHAEAEQILREVNQSKKNLAVLFIDLDHFKKVNDSFGHPAGDKLLVEVATRLKQKCINMDICGRLSGDEFLFVIVGKKVNELNNFIEDLRLSISQPLDIDGSKVTPSASIGVSIFPEDGHDIGTLIHRADMAMYQAKIAGKGRFSFFSHELDKLALERQELEMELEKAISNNELELHYQPQIQMKTGKLNGVEALARWNHPKFGPVSPSKFIPLAEECGLIGNLSRWVLSAACQQMSIWRSKEIAIPTVSVNLSPLNFHSFDLCNLIMSELANHHLKASDLMIEITESTLMDTNPGTIKVLHDIHSKGVGFSIDDFGTGYSSLSYLRKIPIRELKLDRSFVVELEMDDASQALSRAVLQIGQSLKLDVVAEGIETKEQFDILKKQGYQVAQGFLFSKPLNATEIEIWLKNAKEHTIKSSYSS